MHEAQEQAGWHASTLVRQLGWPFVLRVGASDVVCRAFHADLYQLSYTTYPASSRMAVTMHRPCTRCRTQLVVNQGHADGACINNRAVHGAARRKAMMAIMITHTHTRTHT